MQHVLLIGGGVLITHQRDLDDLGITMGITNSRVTPLSAVRLYERIVPPRRL
jgi:hypothetical protein